jgi:PKD repeat protein
MGYKIRLEHHTSLLREKYLVIMFFLPVMLTLLASSSSLAAVGAADRAIFNDNSIWLDGPASLMVGQTYAYQITAAAPDIFGGQIDLSFDPTYLQVLDDSDDAGIQIMPGSCPEPDFVVQNSADNAAGSIRYAATSLAPTVPCDGGVVATFRVLVLAAGSTSVSFNSAILSDINGKQIPATTVDLGLEMASVEADFSAAPLAGNAPLLVNFNNLSTGVFDTCQWDFGDGSKSSDCSDPSHTYVSPGTYTVSLAVDGAGGSDSAAYPDLITVSEATAADFKAAPTVGPSPLNVTFSNLSSGGYDSCLWTFGDGAKSSDCSDPSHTYVTPGTYTVSLAIDGAGGPGSVTYADLISVNEPAVADFKAIPSMGPKPLLVYFTNLSAGVYDSCKWDFGDGGNSDACDNPKHTYAMPGVYSVSLAIDGGGGPSSVTYADLVTVYEPLVADFRATPTKGPKPLLVTFTNLSEGDYSSCQWDFGDGAQSSDCNPSHNYAVPGRYTVALLVSGPNDSDIETKASYIDVYANGLMLPLILR